MLTPPTAEQVRTLAPDAAAARAGEALARPGRWSATGRSESAAWGLCQGSGSSPYQVAVDLSGPAYKCSCPSRKIPCKHALGLLFVLAGGSLASANLPDWVGTWLDSRASRAVAAASRTERPSEVDPEARARRVEARERKVAAGIEELDRWLGDLVRRGLDSARAEGYRFWDTMGARLVDAQAPSLGRSVRALGSAANAGDAWPHVLLEGTARLHLLCEAYRRIDALPEALRSDIRALVGWTTKEEDLDPAGGVEDRWLVVGRRLDDSGQVMTARTWLLGETTSRFALHLAFGVGAAPPTVVAWPGQAFRATLTFYPSATPLRAAIRPVLAPDGDVTRLPAATTIPAMLAAHAERLAENPFIDAWPVVLDEVVPVIRDGAIRVRHADGVGLPVGPASVAAYLLAVSGGHPVALAAEWDGSLLRPMAVLADSRLVDLEVGGSSEAAPRDGATWPRLVSAALLGTERTGEVASTEDEAGNLVAAAPINDPERRLLATASVIAVRRRAGRRPGVDPSDLPEPAPPDPRPALGGRAARLLGDVIDERRSLLDESLGLVRSSRRRLPEELLPALLAAAGADPSLRATVADLGGPRAAWLAAHVPELRDGALPAAPAAAEAWDEARGARQRALVVQAIRERDPAAGRALVEARFESLAGDERAAVVEALEVGLSPADEAFLEVAFGDRRVDVRRAAADLLARLEESAFARRLAQRAQPLLTSHGMIRASLVATLPTADPELEAAGLAGKPPAGIGERAWLLRQILGRLAPRRWNEWLRADANALVDRALRSEEARPILEGWIDATGRFGDPAWATALLAEPKVAKVTTGIDPGRVLDSLRPADMADVVAAVARNVEPGSLPRLVERCTAPWTKPLVEAVFAVLGRSAGSDGPDHAFYSLVRSAALAVPPDRGSDLEILASHRGEVRPALVAAMDTVRFRQGLHAAFTEAEARPT